MLYFNKIKCRDGINYIHEGINTKPRKDLSYPGSIDGTGLNFSLVSNAMQGICDTAIF